jgi:endonuclease YncB( thermonuclease family)
MKLSVLAAFLTLAALPAYAESVRVVDGDTLKIDGVTYRLALRVAISLTMPRDASVCTPAP